MASVGVHASCEPARSDDPRFAQPLTFRSIDTHRPAQPGSLELFLARLIFAARGLANARLKVSQLELPFEQPMVYCDECHMAALRGKLTHAPSCRTGNVLEILAGICSLGEERPTPTPNRRKEDAPAAETRAEDGKPSRAEFGEPWAVGVKPQNYVLLNSERYHLATLHGAIAEMEEHSDRIAACVNFCAGIATETLQRELPLASAGRRRWNEIQHLRRALPWLGFLPVEADDSAVLR